MRSRARVLMLAVLAITVGARRSSPEQSSATKTGRQIARTCNSREACARLADRLYGTTPAVLQRDRQPQLPFAGGGAIWASSMPLGAELGIAYDARPDARFAVVIQHGLCTDICRPAAAGTEAVGTALRRDARGQVIALVVWDAQFSYSYKLLEGGYTIGSTLTPGTPDYDGLATLVRKAFPQAPFG